jgi:hypothetical protein
MGAPTKGREATQAQIQARLALAERMRARKKHSHYVGLDAAGNSQYRAPCGHLVRGPSIRRCHACRLATRPPGRNAYVARDNTGRSWYTAPCGHLVGGGGTKECRACRHKRQATTRNPAHNPYPRLPTAKGSVVEHRVIAAEVLGRPLKRGEVVHHINMDKTDNRRCNLLICSDSYHHYLHHAMAKAYARRCVAS